MGSRDPRGPHRHAGRICRGRRFSQRASYVNGTSIAVDCGLVRSLL